ncbi:hypothetical protein [uncultured Selenomonas sp.]|uniref:hypothetical protein n=1 Tax=uncultured Selenomonas sp. TaxID=159275 RepID=UPI0028EB5794|nr:hypothetical protein [uncultured Selenomonas sp.]
MQTFKASTMNASHHAQVRIKENDRPHRLNRDSTIVGGRDHYALLQKQAEKWS